MSAGRYGDDGAGNEIRVTKVQPPRPVALARQQAQPEDRCSAAESTTEAEVSRQRRMLAARFMAARVGCQSGPTQVIGNPSVVIVVVMEGDQLGMRFTPKLGLEISARPTYR